MTRALIIVQLLLLLSCQEEGFNRVQQSFKLNEINDSSWVENPSYPKGDTRRYGIFPNKPIDHQKLSYLIELCKKGMLIKFSKGVYDINLILKGEENLQFEFEDATLTGALEVIDDADKVSNHITFKGKVTVLDKVFIRKSQNIKFDTLIVKTDTLNSIYNKMNRGVSIYIGSKDISIQALMILNTGGLDDEFYKHSAAALQVHGWNNNPERITIGNLWIENVQRTAVYLTGNEHKIKKATIKNYAQGGKTKTMFGLDDAKPGTEKEFAGFWINKCNDCTVDSLEIINNFQKAFALKFGIGTYSKPAIINHLGLKGQAKEALIQDDLLTNVLVKHAY